MIFSIDPNFYIIPNRDNIKDIHLADLLAIIDSAKKNNFKLLYNKYIDNFHQTINSSGYVNIMNEDDPFASVVIFDGDIFEYVEEIYEYSDVDYNSAFMQELPCDIRPYLEAIFNYQHLNCNNYIILSNKQSISISLTLSCAKTITFFIEKEVSYQTMSHEKFLHIPYSHIYNGKEFNAVLFKKYLNVLAWIVTLGMKESEKFIFTNNFSQDIKHKEIIDFETLSFSMVRGVFCPTYELDTHRYLLEVHPDSLSRKHIYINNNKTTLYRVYVLPLGTKKSIGHTRRLFYTKYDSYYFFLGYDPAHNFNYDSFREENIEIDSKKYKIESKK